VTLPARLLSAAVSTYRQWVSPLLGRRCRYEPTCSAYALEALRIHGAWRGGVLALRRIGRCHPLTRGGVDPVPGSRGPGSG
jgi:putative membrane protein insertion efficiency factor